MRWFIIYFLLIGCFAFSQKNKTRSDSSNGFMPNVGQFVDQSGNPNHAVKFLLETEKMSIQLRKGGFSYDFFEYEYSDDFFTKKTDKKLTKDDLKIDFHRVDFEFINYNLDYKIVQENKQKTEYNYYNEQGNFERVRKFTQITYENFYDGIDIIFKANNNKNFFEYDFKIRRGADLSQIQFKINGANSKIVEDYIKLTTRFGDAHEIIPNSYAVKGPEKEIKIEVLFKKMQNGLYGFDFTKNLDKNNYDELVIDPIPVRKWGTYFGNNPSIFYTNKIESANEKLYVAGTTNISGLATSGVFQGSFAGNMDIAIMRLNEDSFIEWFTYYGGSGLDVAYDFEIDNEDNIIFCGISGSNNMATSGTHQTVKNGWDDGFISKLNNDGTRVWGTYFGGENYDYIYGITLIDNDIYIGGSTNSLTNIASSGAYQTEKTTDDNDITDGFYGRFTPAGERVWSSYYGGTNPDELRSVDYDGFNGISFTGFSNSYNDLALGNVQHTTGVGYSTGIILKVDTSGQPMWCTFIGGESYSRAYAIDHDSNGNIVIVGDTSSHTEITTEGTHQSEFFPEDNITDVTAGFIQKFSPNGFLAWGTYITGEGYDELDDVIVTESDEIYTLGTAGSSTNIVTPNAYDTTEANGDNMLSKFTRDGQMIWSTYYGGPFRDYGLCLTVEDDIIYISGTCTSRYSVATPNTHQPNKGEDYSAFFIKFKECETTSEINMNGNLCEDNEVELTATGGNSYQWYSIEGYISSEQSITVEATSQIKEYFVYIENGDCSEVLSILINEIEDSEPIPDFYDLPVIQAYCEVSLTPPTATDPCDGQIIATTTSPLTYNTPGYYSVEWIYTDSSGNTITQVQDIEVLAGEDLFTSSGEIYYCDQTLINLTSATSEMTSTSGLEFTFYETTQDIENGNPILNPQSYDNSNQNASVLVIAEKNGCSDTEEIFLFISSQPDVSDIIISSCDLDEDGFAEFNLNQYLGQIADTSNTFTFYTDSTYTQPIPAPIYVGENGETIHCIVSNNICENYATITLTISTISMLSSSGLKLCDETSGDYVATFNLQDSANEISQILSTDSDNIVFYESIENVIAHTNSLNNNYTNSSNPQTIYATDNTQQDCPTIISVELEVTEGISFTPQTEYFACTHDNLTLDAGDGYESYTWNTGDTTQTITTSTPGTYQITVSQNNCEVSQYIEVFHYPEIIFDYTNVSNGIQIQTQSGNSPFTYSIDGQLWQNSPIFDNLSEGNYDFFVKDVTGCIVSKNITYIKKQNNIITPNNDGFNDVIIFRKSKDDTNVAIYNRFGKLIFTKAYDETGLIIWNGYYKGNNLPTGTYYYIISNKEKEKKTGFITLKNY